MRRLFVVIVLGFMMALLTMITTGTAADPKIDLRALASKHMPVLLEFGRGWCIPCKYMKPILDDMARAYAGRAIVTTVDMDANKDLVRDFRVRMMPTQVFLTPDGKEFFRNEGTLEREQIAQVFAKMGVPVAMQQAPVPPPEAGSRPVLPPVLPLQPGNVR
jgi:thioredoxin 1